MVRPSLLALAALACALPGVAIAAEQGQSWPEQIRQDLSRLGQVEWRMRVSAADSCPARAAAAGVVLDYIGAYEQSDRDFIRGRAGLGELPQIIAVTEGGPAQSAGIQAGDEIVAIGGTPILAPFAGDEASELLADEIQDRIAAYPPGQSITLSIRRGGREFPVDVTLASVCSARFILKTGNDIEAYSDGDNVAVTTATIRFARNDDELALVTGHELAHVIEYDGKPAGLFGRRRMEDRADLFGAKLAHCAGYDVERSVAFWQRFAKRDLLGWLRGPTHRSAGARHELLSEATAALDCS